MSIHTCCILLALLLFPHLFFPHYTISRRGIGRGGKLVVRFTYFWLKLCLTYSVPLEEENPSNFALSISVLAIIRYHTISYQDKESDKVYHHTIYSLPFEKESQRFLFNIPHICHFLTLAPFSAQNVTPKGA